MSEKMYPIPFRSLMNWILAEREKTGEVFGVHKRWIADPAKTLPIFGEKIESPFGPAAGPNSQLAQNIIAAYVAGARFFEVKTVQKMDGAELAACVPRPCILADDEGYNQEWSTELEVVQALDEYVKAWFALKIMAKVWHYGDPDGFVFNMSVGYDLEGIRGPKIDHYIESMKDASQLPVFAECRKVLTELFPEEAAFIASISPQVSHSITLSTLHGCPPDEIERIASYLHRPESALSDAAVHALLEGCPWPINVLPTVDSTNTYAKAQAALGAPHGSVYVTGRQTGGRGRRGRTFVSPPGGVYLSVLLRPQREAAELLWLTAAVAVAIRRAIRDCCPADVGIKWTNDLVIGKRKVCGILTELAALASSMASSMALLMTSGSMEYSSGIGFVTSMPPRRPSSCCVLKALARSSGVSIS